MRHSFALSLLVLAAGGATATAQTKFTMSGKCGKPDVQQAVPAADAADHLMTLAQGKCTPLKAAQIAGSPSKEATFTEHGEVKGDSGHVSGMYVDTLANGEKVYYRYESTSSLKGGTLSTMQNKWQIEGGTAKLKGIKGQGTCSGKAAADGSLDFECQGEYSLPK
jgi:hypothetical protein